MNRSFSRHLLILMLFLMHMSVSGQNIFSLTYSFGVYNEGIKSFNRPDSGYLVLGNVTSSHATTGLWVLKIDKSGNPLYEAVISDTFNLVTKDAIIVEHALYVTGYATMDQGHKLFLMKADTLGHRQWIVFLHDFDWSFGESICFRDYLYVAGSARQNPGFSDALFVRFDTTGLISSMKLHGDSTRDEVFLAVDTAVNNHLILAGYIESGNNGKDILLSKLSSKGDTIWQKVISNPGKDIATDIHPAIQGGYYLCGTSESYFAFKEDPFVMTINELGVRQWATAQGGSENDGYLSIVQLPDTSYRSAGFFNDSLYGGSNHLCVTNCAKTGYWDASLGGAIIGGNKNDKANHLLVTLDSGFLATGTSESYGDALSSLFIVKSGPLVETVIWSGHIHTFIEQFPEKITQQISVYPNPAVNYCVIRHPVVKNNASVVLFGIDGALLMTVPVVSGSKETTINISNLAKGVYFARFFDGSNYASPAVKKIVKH